MLKSLDGQQINEIPHGMEYRIWRSRLTDREYSDLIQVLTDRISGGSIHTSSWIPGSDWSGTPYMVIYERACDENEEHAAMFFGLILWHAIMLHPEEWYFYKADNIRGTTYFRPDNVLRFNHG